MDSILGSSLAFILAIGVLVTVHEFGHFWVAKRMGVRVLRFSVGFGRPILRYQRSPNDTEYVVAAIPLGGYVKMLDEREGEVAPEELHLAFNRKPISSRIAVVIAGPLFNLLFAVLAYWAMFVVGIPGERPLIGDVVEGGLAAQAGFVAGDEIRAVDGRSTPSWELVSQALLKAAIDGEIVEVLVTREGGVNDLRRLDLRDSAGIVEDPGGLLAILGLEPWVPKGPPLVGYVEPNSPAEQAGLQPGDQLVSVNGQKLTNPTELVEIVRAHPGESLEAVVDRDEKQLFISLTPERIPDKAGEFGRIGAQVQHSPRIIEKLRIKVRYNALAAAQESVRKTWDTSILILKMLGKMVVGEASLKNISGPVTIAQYAGKSASMGWLYYVKLLAFLSISLGVLNLLPIPVLDGGHLMYYLVEIVKGSPVSDAVMVIGQQVGIVLLAALMGLAFYNDFARLFG